MTKSARDIAFWIVVIIACLACSFGFLYAARAHADEACGKLGPDVRAISTGQFRYICVDGQGRIVGDA